MSDEPQQQAGKASTAGLRGLLRSFGFAFSGVGQTVKGERNMRIHIAFAVFAVVMCAVLRCTPVEWAVIVVIIALVFSAEMINTAIESVVDLVSPDLHPLAKRAKDVAAAAVLVLAIAAVVAGLIIYISAFLRLGLL